MSDANLLISSKNYSSWSLRGFLLARLARLDFEERVVDPERSQHPGRTVAARFIDPRAVPGAPRGDGVGHPGDRRIPERGMSRRRHVSR